MADLPPDAQAIEDARPHVLEQAVRCLDKLEEDLPIGVIGEVECNRAFITVPAHEPAAVGPVLVVDGEGAQESHQLTSRRFDLDDLGTEVGQHHRPVGSGCGMCDVENAQAHERAGCPVLHGGRRLMSAEVVGHC